MILLPDAVDESALDCTVKNSPTASGDQDDKKSVPKIKVKDNLLESKPYEKNSLVEKIKLMEESNSLDETGAVSDEDNLMIDINPADVQCVQDDKDSESSQDSVEFRLVSILYYLFFFKSTNLNNLLLDP